MAKTDSQYWSEKLQELERAQLDTVQKSATAWSSLLAGILGVFGLVAFAGGLTAIDKLASPWDSVMKGITAAAATALLCATYLAAKAAGDLSPKAKPGMTWQELEADTRRRASVGLVSLGRAKAAGVIAAALVVVGSGIVLFLDPKTSTDSSSVIATVDGLTSCGELEIEGDHLAVNGVVLSGEVVLVPVERCPSK